MEESVTWSKARLRLASIWVFSLNSNTFSTLTQNPRISYLWKKRDHHPLSIIRQLNHHSWGGKTCLGCERCDPPDVLLVFPLRPPDRSHLVSEVLLNHFGTFFRVELLRLDLLVVDCRHPGHLLEHVVPMGFLDRAWRKLCCNNSRFCILEHAKFRQLPEVGSGSLASFLSIQSPSFCKMATLRGERSTFQFIIFKEVKVIATFSRWELLEGFRVTRWLDFVLCDMFWSNCNMDKFIVTLANQWYAELQTKNFSCFARREVTHNYFRNIRCD